MLGAGDISVASLVSLALATLAILVYGCRSVRPCLPGPRAPPSGSSRSFDRDQRDLVIKRRSRQGISTLRRSFARVSDDQRVQAVIIAFPLAHCWRPRLPARGRGDLVMLMALGFKLLKAAALALDLRSRARRVRAMATPILTLAGDRAGATPSARWWAGRPRSWRCSCRWCWSRSSTVGAASGKPGRWRWSAASSSVSRSTRPPTSSRFRWPTWSRRCCRRPRSSRWCASGIRAASRHPPSSRAAPPTSHTRVRAARTRSQPDDRAEVARAYAPTRSSSWSS